MTIVIGLAAKDTKRSISEPDDGKTYNRDQFCGLQSMDILLSFALTIGISFDGGEGVCSASNPSWTDGTGWDAVFAVLRGRRVGGTWTSPRGCILLYNWDI